MKYPKSDIIVLNVDIEFGKVVGNTALNVVMSYNKKGN